jgi:glycerol-3-phosphate dehydrogenase
MNGRCQGFYCGAHTCALLESRGVEATDDMEAMR